MTDDIKQAELRGYARGYQAGKRKKARIASDEQRRAKEDALWQRVYLALLPAAMAAQGWKFGEQPIRSTEDRVRLAVVWTNHALTAAKREGRA